MAKKAEPLTMRTLPAEDAVVPTLAVVPELEPELDPEPEPEPELPATVA